MHRTGALLFSFKTQGVRSPVPLQKQFLSGWFLFFNWFPFSLMWLALGSAMLESHGFSISLLMVYTDFLACTIPRPPMCVFCHSCHCIKTESYRRYTYLCALYAWCTTYYNPKWRLGLNRNSLLGLRPTVPQCRVNRVISLMSV